MAFDGVTINHLVRELAPQLAGTRIDKIHQPEKEEIHLILRQPGQSVRLLLNSGATSARFHLTTQNKKNPAAPPMFCMILRKHLEGGIIQEFSQFGLERVVKLTIQNYNERGDRANFHLYLEIMGKHSNLLLVDPETNLILDGIKRYSHAVSRHREVLPGRPYLAPPSQDKLEPVADEEIWRKHLYQEDLESPLAKILVARFAGISPELAREIILQASLEAETKLSQCGDIDISRLFQAYNLLGNPDDLLQINPCLYFNSSQSFETTAKNRGITVINGTPAAFTFVPFHQYSGIPCKTFSTLNEAVLSYYQLKSSNNSLEAKRGSLRKLLLEQIGHLSKKLNIYEDALTSAQNALSFGKWGELLTANLYRITPGSKEATLEDYYQEELPLVTIPLEPNLTANENAQRYYRLYNKAKATLQKTEPLKQSTLEESAYLESIIVSLEQSSSLAELDEINLELIDQSYIATKNDKKNKNKKTKPENPVPRVFYSSQDRVIYVGKNNRQNDWLTIRKARPQDLWLHVKEIPGSHVLVPLEDGEEFPDDTTLEEAAALAIYYSQARGSTLVPVDYTHIGQIKKPNGAKPGMVIYEKYWTLYLTPKNEVLEKLHASEEEANE